MDQEAPHKTRMNTLQRVGAAVFAVVLVVVLGFLAKGSVDRIDHVSAPAHTGEDLEELAELDFEFGEESTQIPIVMETHLLPEEIETFASAIQSGGPPKDGIPPVDDPTYISVSESEDFLDDQDWVFAAIFPDGVRLYPQKILVWHEIVNDTFDGRDGSVTYCPLTGTVIGFWGDFAGAPTTFGTSGKLLNSNLVMYDRETDSYWPQILRTAITGDRTGNVLDSFQMHWVTWENAKQAFPDAQVLSRSTGFIRAYGNDPYGDYDNDGSYYNSGGAFFKLTNDDDRLPEKEVVIGVYADNGSTVAIPKSKVRAEGRVEFVLGDRPAVAIWDDELESVSVFDGIDEVSWITSMDAMWFAWAADFPDTELIQ